jgi:cholesterol transport system auxiliary component
MSRLACVVLSGLAVASCSIGKPVPQAKTYVVEPTMPTPGLSAVRRSETVRFGNVRVAAAFAGSALIYRMDEVHFTSDPYSAFIAEPGAMLADQMAAWLDRAGPFKTVTQPETTRNTSYVLEAVVTELYGDFRRGQGPAAVLMMRFALIDQTGVRPKSLLEHAIGRRVSIARASPDALVRGYGSALDEILGELRMDLQGAVAAR